MLSKFRISTSICIESFLLVALLIATAGEGRGQGNDYYLVSGNVIDARGLPFGGANLCLEPAVNVSKAFDSFIECIGTNDDGSFTIRKFRNSENTGKDFRLTVFVESFGLMAVDLPFDGVRRYDSTFDGKLVKLGNKGRINVGKVQVQFSFTQVTLRFPAVFSKVDWSELGLKIKDWNGHLIYFSTLSQDDMRSYLRNLGRELTISLPEGRWKAEIVNFDTERVLAKSAAIRIGRYQAPLSFDMKAEIR